MVIRVYDLVYVWQFKHCNYSRNIQALNNLYLISIEILANIAITLACTILDFIVYRIHTFLAQGKSYDGDAIKASKLEHERELLLQAKEIDMVIICF